MTPMKARRGISGEQIEAIGSLPRSLAASLTVSRTVQRGTCAYCAARRAERGDSGDSAGTKG